MFKIKKILLFFLLLIIFYNTHAQANFVEGTVIQLNGDSLKGEVNYQEWLYNPRIIEFRQGNMQNIKAYNSKDIKGFIIGYKNEKYQSAVVDVDNESLETQKLKSYNSFSDIKVRPQLTSDTVFLLVEEQGRLNLYSLLYKDDKPHYFIQKGDGKIEELGIQRARITNRDTNSVITIQTYKNQLQILTTDCTTQKHDFTKLRFVKSEILEVVTQYNKCHNQSFYTHKEKSGQKKLLFFSGAVLPRLALDDSYNTKGKAASRFVSPLLGIAFEQSFYRLRNKLGVGIELNVAYYKANITIPNLLFGNNRVVYYNVNSVAAKLTPYLRYVFTAGVVQPFIKAGFGYTFFSKPYVEHYYTESSFPAVNLPPLDMSKRRLYGFGSVGLRVKNYFIESRFESNFRFGYVDYYSAIGTTKPISFLLGYSWNFSKKQTKK